MLRGNSISSSGPEWFDVGWRVPLRYHRLPPRRSEVDGAARTGARLSLAVAAIWSTAMALDLAGGAAPDLMRALGAAGGMGLAAACANIAWHHIRLSAMRRRRRLVIADVVALDIRHVIGRRHRWMGRDRESWQVRLACRLDDGRTQLTVTPSTTRHRRFGQRVFPDQASATAWVEDLAADGRILLLVDPWEPTECEVASMSARPSLPEPSSTPCLPSRRPMVGSWEEVVEAVFTSPTDDDARWGELAEVIELR